MKTKLTLRIEEPVIKAAKTYSRKSGKSLSQLVSDYFVLVTHDKPTNKDLEALPPITRSLKGILKNKKISIKDYKKYLEDKYL